MVKTQEIYLIETSSGSYEDYYTGVSKAFFLLSDAEQYIKEYNENLSSKQVKRYKCDRCPINCYYDEEDEEYKKWVATVEQECKEFCDSADISVAGKDYYTCKNEVDRFIDEEHEARIKRININ